MIEFLRAVQSSYGMEQNMYSYFLSILLHVVTESLICMKEAFRFRIYNQLSIYDEAMIVRYYPISQIFHCYVPQSLSDAMMMHIARCVSQSQVKSAQIYLAHGIWLHLALFVILTIGIAATNFYYYNFFLTLCGQLLTTFADAIGQLLMAVGHHGLYGVLQLMRTSVSVFYLRISQLNGNVSSIDGVAHVIQVSQIVDAIPGIMMLVVFFVREYHLRPAFPRAHSFFPVNFNVIGKLLQLFFPILLSRCYVLIALYEHPLNAINAYVTFKQRYYSIIESCSIYFYTFISTSAARIVRQPSLCYFYYFQKPKTQLALAQLMLIIASAAQMCNLFIIGYAIDWVAYLCNLAFQTSLIISTSIIVMNDIMLLFLFLHDRYVSATIAMCFYPIIICVFLLVTQMSKFTLSIALKLPQILIGQAVILYLVNAYVFVQHCRMVPKVCSNKGEKYMPTKWE